MVWIKEAFREANGSTHRLLYEAAPAYVLLAAASRNGSYIIDGLTYPFAPNAVHFALPGQRVERLMPASSASRVRSLRAT